MDEVYNYGLTLLITEPTRQGSCIDHIISNLDNAKGCIHKVYLSDHETCQTFTVPIPNRHKTSHQWYIEKETITRKI